MHTLIVFQVDLNVQEGIVEVSYTTHEPYFVRSTYMRVVEMDECST